MLTLRGVRRKDFSGHDIRLEWIVALVVGFFVHGVLTFLAAHMGLLNIYVICSLWLSGVACAFINRDMMNIIWPKQWRFNRRETVLLGLCVSFLVAKWLTTLLPLGHGDPLYYHLPSAWLWASAHKAYFVETIPWILQGGLAEYVYAQFAVITQERFATMLLAQMTHCFVGLIVSAALVYMIIRRWVSRDWAFVAVLGFVTFGEETMMLVRAKNDGYVLACCMASLAFICRYRQDASRRSLVWGVVTATMGLGFKHTALFYIVPLAPLLFFMMAKEHMLWGMGAAFSTLLFAALPMLRNYWYTGNPLFPAFSEHFPNQYMNLWLTDEVNGFSYVSGSWYEQLKAQVSRIWLGSCFYPLAFFAWRSRLRWLWWLACLATAFLIVMTGQGWYARFHFYLYALLAILATSLAAEWAERRVWILWLCLGLIFAKAQFEVPFTQFFLRTVPYVMNGESLDAYFSAIKPNHAMVLWMNAHIKTPAKIFSFYDNESYFLNFPLTVPENHRAANDIWQLRTYDEITAGLKREGYTHLLIPPGKEDYFGVLTKDARFQNDFTQLQHLNGYTLMGWR